MAFRSLLVKDQLCLHISQAFLELFKLVLLDFKFILEVAFYLDSILDLLLLETMHLDLQTRPLELLIANLILTQGLTLL